MTVPAEKPSGEACLCRTGDTARGHIGPRARGHVERTYGGVCDRPDPPVKERLWRMSANVYSSPLAVRLLRNYTGDHRIATHEAPPQPVVAPS